MKIWWIILIIVGAIIFIALALITFGGFGFCTAEARICPDGSTVGRSGPQCSFGECPALVDCEFHGDCPQGFECLKVNETEPPYCYKGDYDLHCVDQCGFPSCDVIDSDPKRISCS